MLVDDDDIFLHDLIKNPYYDLGTDA